MATSKKRILQMITLAAALFVLACFFIPWVEFGVSILKTNLSGYQLATGAGPAGRKIHDWPSLLFIPACMVTAILATASALMGNASSPQRERFIGVLVSAAGCLSAFVMLYQYVDMNAEFNKNILGVVAQNLVTHLFGWGASLAGSVAVLITGVLSLQLRGVTSEFDAGSRTVRAGSYLEY